MYKVLNLGPHHWAPARGSTVRYAPASASPRTILGNSGHRLGVFEESRLPTSLFLASGGIAAVYFGGVMPSPVDVVIRALGIGAIGYAVYHVFSGEEPVTGDIAPPEVPPSERAPKSPKEVYETFVISLDSLQVNTGSIIRSMTSNQEYEFSVLNQGTTAKSVYAGLAVADEDGKILFQSNPKDPGPAGRKLIDKIPPRKSVTKKLTAPETGFSVIPYIVTVQVELFRNRDDQEPFLRSDAIGIKMAHPGFA